MYSSIAGCNFLPTLEILEKIKQLKEKKLTKKKQFKIKNVIEKNRKTIFRDQQIFGENL